MYYDICAALVFILILHLDLISNHLQTTSSSLTNAHLWNLGLQYLQAYLI